MASIFPFCPFLEIIFKQEMPDEMVLLGLNKNAFLFDGKDTLSKTIQKDDPQCHRQHSSKMNTSTYWWINFTLNVALSFEHSHAYFACATEESLVQLHCSYDKEEAPIKEWKDYAKKNQEWEVLIYWTGLDDIVSLEEATKIIEINELQDQPQEEHRDERAGEGQGKAESRDDSGCGDNQTEFHDDSEGRGDQAPPLDGSSDINQGDGSNEDFLAGFDEWFSDGL
jgi:hypothetical protein